MNILIHLKYKYNLKFKVAIDSCSSQSNFNWERPYNLLINAP